ncbi:MAG TPA: ROK family protein, partial [Ignavibacteriales bacterium]|nr:ROK family protein [Ignavibacteriales bacterium]
RDSIRINSNKSVIELVEYITKMVSLIIEKAQVGRNKILGVGIAFAGIVNSAEGVVIMSGVLPELNFDLLKKIKEKLPYPVMIENNANASAIGAKWTGEMKTVRNYISVLIEFDSMVGGIGMGIVLEGEIYHGASYASGELFPNLPTLYEMLCAVRSRLSDGKILKKFAAHVEDIDITILMDAAQQGDETAQLIISRLGNRIGQIIAPAISVLNPEALILTGDIAQVGEMIIKPLRQTIDLEVLSISSKALRITANPQHKYSVAIGAGGVVLSNFFKIPTFS